MKVTNEYYQFFGELAIALQTKDIKMSFKTLNKMLVDNGFEPYGSSRALARGLSAAYREWERQEKANGLFGYSKYICEPKWRSCMVELLIP